LNQIEKLKTFLKSKEKSLIINQLNESVDIFYKYIIYNTAKKNNLEIFFNEDVQNNNKISLFDSEKIDVYQTTSTKKIENLIEIQSKKIIFTDYKNFKKLKDNISILNSYQYEEDITIYLMKELNISDKNLITFCKNNPALFYSETSKYLVYNKYLYQDNPLINSSNHILDIRKSIFENKKNNYNIKNLYLNIKKEAEYKKLSFLTY